MSSSQGIPVEPLPAIVISGLGICSPLGPDRETTWRRLLAGDRSFDGIDPARGWFGGRAARAAGGPDQPSVADLAVQVAGEAITDSRLDGQTLASQRCGVVFGTSKGELGAWLDAPEKFAWTDLWPHGAASRLARMIHSQGPVLCPVAACATGLVACVRAAALIASDQCDIVLAGSADASLIPAVIGSYQRLGVLAKIAGDPASACKPFDRQRSGFLIGEGAACLIFERKSHALGRGARWYGEWLGGRLACDPSGLTPCDPEARSLTHLISSVLAEAGQAPDYINLHGTATKVNDVAECRAVRAVLGRSVAAVSCSGLKGSLGHLLGAAGSVELALTLLALRDQIVPATVNLNNPDPDCDLDLTPGVPRRRPLRTALKISSGFGGHLAAALISRS